MEKNKSNQEAKKFKKPTFKTKPALKQHGKKKKPHVGSKKRN